MQGLKLEQMTLLVGCPAGDGSWRCSWRIAPLPPVLCWLWPRIKPQLVWLLLLWLVIWTLADWRRRYRWAASFLFTMAILCAASEWYLPHWISRFWQAIREYRQLHRRNVGFGRTDGRTLEPGIRILGVGAHDGCLLERPPAGGE